MYYQRLLSILLVSIAIVAQIRSTSAYMGDSSSKRRCQDITIPLCKGMAYNRTYMPNQFNHLTQEEAGMEVHQFWPLVEINCSPDLKFFLCSMYTPICIDTYSKPLPVCRSVCERAKAGCLGLMHSYGFEWPKHLDCEKLPVFGHPTELCMDQNQTDKSIGSGGQQQSPSSSGGIGGGNDQSKLGSSSFPRPPSRPDSIPSVFTDEKSKKPDSLLPLPGMRPPILNGQIKNNGDSIIGGGAYPKRCQCGKEQCMRSPRFRFVHDLEAKRVGVANISGCTYACRQSLTLVDKNHHLIHFWIGLWSVLCCASTLFTVLTFAIDMSRFRYPERPIIFLSFCYFMVSVGYILRVAAGHDAVACDGDHIRTQTTGPALCTIVFVLIYFFGMASSVWWVNLSLTWFLAAGLKWSNEAIAGYSQYFHIAAWAIPSIKTVAILALSGVDGDPVSGICYVGNTNVTMMRVFVLAPLFAYLVLGSFFLLSGFVSLVRIHNIVKQQHGGVSKIEKLEKLMVRIGIFSVLYTIPATFVVGCYFYEQHYRSNWELTSLCENKDVCTAEGRFTLSEMDFPMFVVKYFMCLIVGMTSGFWIWSRKTLDSWRRFIQLRLCCCCCRSSSSSSTAAATSTSAALTRRSLDAANGQLISSGNMYNNVGQQQQLLLGGQQHQQMIGQSASPREFYDYNGGGSASGGLLRSMKGGGGGGGGASSAAGGYMPAEAILIKSHTDISSGCYSRQYPVNHV